MTDRRPTSHGPKRPVGFKFTEEAISLLQTLSAKLGISQAAILEILIREKAKEEGVRAK